MEAPPIENLKIGDFVVAFDETKQDTVLSRVTNVVQKTWYELRRIIAGQDTILATENHPFFLPCLNRYLPADSLRQGMQLLSLVGTLLTVQQVTAIDTTVQVYNFEVEEQHNYFVGEAGILVHNENEDCFLAKAGLESAPGASYTFDIIEEAFGAEALTLRPILSLELQQADDPDLYAFFRADDILEETPDIALAELNVIRENRVRAWEVAYSSQIDGLTYNFDFLNHLDGDQDLLTLFRNSTDVEHLADWWVRCYNQSNVIFDFATFIAQNPDFKRFLTFVDNYRNVAQTLRNLDPIEFFLSWKQLDEVVSAGFLSIDDLVRPDYVRYIFDERVDEAVYFTRFNRTDVITTPPFSSLNFIENVSINNWSRGGDRINGAILSNSADQFDLTYKATLNTALSKLPNTNKTVLWRASFRSDVSGWTTGETKTWNTFFACTHKHEGLAGFLPAVEGHNVVFIVEGSNSAKHIESISYYNSESELLYPTGKTFEVLSNEMEPHPLMGTAFEDAWLSHPANPNQSALIRVIRLSEQF